MWVNHSSHTFVIDLFQWSYLSQHLVQRLVTGPDCGASMFIHPINAVELYKEGESSPGTDQTMACNLLLKHVT